MRDILAPRRDSHQISPGAAYWNHGSCRLCQGLKPGAPLLLWQLAEAKQALWIPTSVFWAVLEGP